MCLILFAVNPNPEYRLIVAANRDEFYSRVSETAHFWTNKKGILAGRDNYKGGTWLGVKAGGRFAAVTNFREESLESLPKRTRGELPIRFLQGEKDPLSYSEDVSEKAKYYRGFNLITANEEKVVYYCNRQKQPKVLNSGFYGLSNQALDCNWPKVIEGRKKLESLIRQKVSDLPKYLFKILLNQGDDREFSNSFIKGSEYGTRAATVIMIKQNGEISFEERTFGSHGISINETTFFIDYTDDS